MAKKRDIYEEELDCKNSKCDGDCINCDMAECPGDVAIHIAYDDDIFDIYTNVKEKTDYYV